MKERLQQVIKDLNQLSSELSAYYKNILLEQANERGERIGKNYDPISEPIVRMHRQQLDKTMGKIGEAVTHMEKLVHLDFIPTWADQVQLLMQELQNHRLLQSQNTKTEDPLRP